MNLIIYGCLVGASFMFAFIRAHCFLVVSLRCSERLHDKMVLAVLRAPVPFFESNPVGRIMNRFSKDVSCMDEVLHKTLFYVDSIGFAVVCVNTSANCCKSLASLCCCTDRLTSRVYFAVLLEDIKGVKKVRVNLP